MDFGTLNLWYSLRATAWPCKQPQQTDCILFYAESQCPTHRPNDRTGVCIVKEIEFPHKSHLNSYLNARRTSRAEPVHACKSSKNPNLTANHPINERTLNLNHFAGWNCNSQPPAPQSSLALHPPWNRPADLPQPQLSNGCVYIYLQYLHTNTQSCWKTPCGIQLFVSN